MAKSVQKAYPLDPLSPLTLAMMAKLLTSPSWLYRPGQPLLVGYEQHHHASTTLSLSPEHNIPSLCLHPHTTATNMILSMQDSTHHPSSSSLLIVSAILSVAVIYISSSASRQNASQSWHLLTLPFLSNNSHPHVYYFLPRGTPTTLTHRKQPFEWEGGNLLQKFHRFHQITLFIIQTELQSFPGVNVAFLFAFY